MGESEVAIPLNNGKRRTLASLNLNAQPHMVNLRLSGKSTKGLPDE